MYFDDLLYLLFLQQTYIVSLTMYLFSPISNVFWKYQELVSVAGKQQLVYLIKIMCNNFSFYCCKPHHAFITLGFSSMVNRKTLFDESLLCLNTIQYNWGYIKVANILSRVYLWLSTSLPVRADLQRYYYSINSFYHRMSHWVV